MKQMRSEKFRVISLAGGEELSSNAPFVPAADSCVIEIKNATLQYPVGPYVRGSLKANLMRLVGYRRESVGTAAVVNAFKDLSLTFSHGDRVGIVGQNGSGKSTLLRALAGIYPLHAGSIKVFGQVGALLDIGLGFESESTGRENIYYRGMAMGYSRAKLRTVEQEIIRFADLGEFIDLPMRTYSSGMYIRLGFAISTQFAPDVLLIDEVFGAGDAAFAERALARMMGIVQNAGIVILASHDVTLMRRVCKRVIWLHKGDLMEDGSPDAVIPRYLEFMSGVAAQ